MVYENSPPVKRGVPEPVKGEVVLNPPNSKPERTRQQTETIFWKSASTANEKKIPIFIPVIYSHTDDYFYIYPCWEIRTTGQPAMLKSVIFINFVKNKKDGHNTSK